MTMPAPIEPAPIEPAPVEKDDGPSPNSASAVLELIVHHAHEGIYEGFFHQLGADLGLSPTQVSRAVRALRDAERIEVLRRGHGAHPSRLRVLSREPLSTERERAVRPALADRLLVHLNDLSRGGVVEHPLVEVARELDVGAPSVSRALGRLVDAGLARVDRVGTRGRPTRIALVEAADAHGDGGDELVQLRAENDRLLREVVRLRERLGGSEP